MSSPREPIVGKFNGSNAYGLFRRARHALQSDSRWMTRRCVRRFERPSGIFADNSAIRSSKSRTTSCVMAAPTTNSAPTISTNGTPSARFDGMSGNLRHWAFTSRLKSGVAPAAACFLSSTGSIPAVSVKRDRSARARGRAVAEFPRHFGRTECCGSPLSRRADGQHPLKRSPFPSPRGVRRFRRAHRE